MRDPDERALLADRAVVVQAAQAAAGRGRGARLPDRLGLEGLPADRRGLRHRAAAGPASRRRSCREPIFTPATKAAHRRARREHQLRRRRRSIVGARPRRAGARHRASRSTSTPPSTRASAASSSPTPSSSSALDADGTLHADRRSADARLVALLAGRHLPRGHEPAVVRQAVRARLSRDARLGQDGAGPEAAARGHRAARARSIARRSS